MYVNTKDTENCCLIINGRVLSLKKKTISKNQRFSDIFRERTSGTKWVSKLKYSFHHLDTTILIFITNTLTEYYTMIELTLKCYSKP